MLYRDFLKTREGICSFCEPKDRTILRREHAFITYNLAPILKHQIMVIPSRHVESLTKLSADEAKDISDLITEGIGLLHKLGYSFVSLVLRDGAHPGKSVAHIHYHLMPNVDMRADFDFEKTKREDKRVIMTQEEIRQTLADFERVKNS